MSSVDWDEIKRLAADFQKAQLSSTLQKLSESNCIEIILKLIETNLLDVIFTADGKEYITPQHLEKEIRDELYVCGGRINLVELSKILNVDLSHVKSIVSNIEKHNKNINIILGQVIDNNYKKKISLEINDKLNQIGYINVTELTLQYDLPTEFIQNLVEKELGNTVHGKQDKQDSRIFYTENFIAKNRAKIRGALSAITKPTPLTAILGQCNVPERIFFSILDNLHGAIEVPGVITGKHGNNGIYVPSIYSKSQTEWIDNFYKQNGYLEYDALTRLGISDSKNYIKRHFPQDELTLLDTVAIGPSIIDQIDANIEDVIATNSFIDIYPLLPSVFSPEDIETILKYKQKQSKSIFHIFSTTVIVSDEYLKILNKPLESIAEIKAKEFVDNGKWLQHIADNKIRSGSSRNIESIKIDKKDERRKKASSGKAGGGGQGRETKTKSTKKKYLHGKNNDYDSDDDNKLSKNNEKNELIFVTIDDLKKKLLNDDNLNDIDGFVDELCIYYQPKLNKIAYSLAEKLAQTTKTNNLSEIEDKLNMLMTNIKIFDKGIKCISSSKDTQIALTKYLMKTLATDFINELLKLAAQQNMIQFPNNLTTETRQKLLQELPQDVNEPLGNVHKAIIKNSIDDFLDSVEMALSSCCLVYRKFDKKREKSNVLEHRQALIEQLNQTQDVALALHLTTSILFTASTQCALHISGRHVSAILTFLQKHLDPTIVTKLLHFHDLVLQLLSSDDETIKETARSSLTEGLEELKNIANDFKKYVVTEKC
ncbi:hypothetical protein HCN44_002530 [Aphidius gifuensis]|uniref:E3 UFM1-protein ligase 1 homolog n=1 Tax=Aphidius gifuensis TaxID=684658 RepID=A0A835CUC2_APHGI|nr:E3 UFM1-protein ligase 1 homolog [Aphidius gifuensis]KAF7996884.1 hypothetical protein HCN44_002530 [Aphidius gifuensis]